MSDSCNANVTVWVLDACSDECTCGSDECKTDLLRKDLETCEDCKDIEWIWSSDWTAGTNILGNVYDSIDRSVKVLVLWNKTAQEFVERYDSRMMSRSKDEKASKEAFDIRLAKFATFYKNTSFVQADKGCGNLIVHVKLEEKAIPTHVEKWEDATICTATDIIERIRGKKTPGALLT